MAEFLTALLPTLQGDATVCVHTRLPLAPPAVSVDGVGALQWPLSRAQADALVRASVRAPFGRGQETVTDLAVRKTWQIDAERVTPGPQWAASLSRIEATLAARLGIRGGVRAQLYKLLLYEVGDFFAEHRDNEKSAGMVGTLLIHLPSVYTGGALTITHASGTTVVGGCVSERESVDITAFYTDCRHEVAPVTSGRRLVLVYNLIRRSAAPLPNPAPPPALIRGLHAWKAGRGPRRLVIPLRHPYTAAELDWAALKPLDVALAGALREAGDQAGCVVGLTLLTREEGGWLRSVESDFQQEELEEDRVTFSAWEEPPLAPQGPLHPDELCPPDALDADPILGEVRIPWGNEPGTFRRTYQRAAVVVWSQGTTPPLERDCSWRNRWIQRRIEDARRTGRLNLSRMGLRWVPGDVASLVELEQLDLSHNALRALPDCLARMSRLAHLSVAGNLLSELPPLPPSLVQLDVSANYLEYIAPRLGELPQLRVLDLSQNYLSDKRLPAALARLERLERLSLHSSYAFYELPIELGRLPALQELHASSMGLTRVAFEAGAYPALRVLDLRENRLRSLPEAVFTLPCLRTLRLAENQAPFCPPAIGALEHLDLSNNTASSVPEAVWGAETLRVLELRKCRLKALPESVGRLSGLRVLDVSDNPLGALPEALSSLPLHTLRAAGCQIKALPADLSALRWLRHLDVSGNPLGRLPAEIGALIRLESLRIAGCRLRALPPELAGLSQLTLLDAEKNALTALPDWIGALSRLKTLHLSQNRLSALPASVGALVRLESLRLEQNPVSFQGGTLSSLTELTELWVPSAQLSDPRDIADWVGWNSHYDSVAAQDPDIPF